MQSHFQRNRLFEVLVVLGLLLTLSLTVTERAQSGIKADIILYNTATITDEVSVYVPLNICQV